MAFGRRKPTVGMMAQFCQAALGERIWLPFMVTHVHSDDMVSGVCFSGEPGPLGWMNRSAQAFDHRNKGSEVGCWRFKPGKNDTMDEPEDVASTEPEDGEFEPEPDQVMEQELQDEPMEGDAEE